jgi:hypothetical protein
MLFYDESHHLFDLCLHTLLSRLVDNETTVVDTYVFIICTG